MSLLRAVPGIVLAGLLLPGRTVWGGNPLSNPGFEDNPAGTNVHPIMGWQAYGPTTLTETDPAHAHSGAKYFKVYGSFTGSDNYSGVFQDVFCKSGAVYKANGWVFSLSTDAIHGQDQIWVEVTFRDPLGNPLALYRSDLVTGSNIVNYGGLDHWFDLKVTNQWSFSVSGGNPVAIAVTNTTAALAAPAGTMFLRYQIVFHQGPDNANGSVYLDDCSLTQTDGPVTAWNIVWSDEFNGSSINPANWVFETGNNNGWGNNELEYYTSRSQNAYVSGGLLHIVAQKESYNGYNYTSARMKTQGLFSKKYGRIDFRAKLPPGYGYWPALWLLGTNIASVSWPACGEVDVMENKGFALTNVQGTIHYSNPTNNSHLQSTAVYTLPFNDSVTNFHNYLLEWTTNMMRFYVDGLLYETQTSWSSSTGPYPAPFNQPFFIIMNIAIGGNYLGNPSTNTINANTTFPGEMQVDYVRVWDLTAPLQISATRSNANLLLTWPTNIVCHLQAQTNAAGPTPNWFDVPAATPPLVVPASSTAPVFYRLESP
jgi:beta-glucanase (GH16 family)